MEKTGQDVGEFVAGVTPARRQRDAGILIDLMREITGREPELWSAGIIGFGTCRYTYPTGTTGLSPIIGFSPRKTASTLYVLDDLDTHAALLDRLGPHKRGKGCLYLGDLQKVDLSVLREFIAVGDAEVRSGGGGYAAFTEID